MASTRQDQRVRVRVVSADGAAVRCSTPAGDVLVMWRGPVTPVVGDDVDVELDAIGALAWETVEHPVTGPTDTTGLDALVGILEHVDSDCAVLRVGGSVALLELTGEAPPAALGQPVRARPERWEAWPTSI